MRKIFANLKSVVALAVVAAMTLSVSCMYDDTALTKRVGKVEKDLATLTERVNALENNKSINDLLNGAAVVTDVAVDEATGNTVITLSNGKTITVLAETLQYRVTDGVLEISADGETWVAVTAAPDAVVKEAVDNEDGTVTITLADGTQFTVAKAELIECEATRTAVYVLPESTKAVPFTVNDAVEDINVMNQPLGWSATVEAAETRAAGGAEYVLNITGPAKGFEHAAKEGVVSVHFNTAAGACKVMNVAVSLAELTLEVKNGVITLTNSVAFEQTNRNGETFIDFADFAIGVMEASAYEQYGDSVFADTFDDYTYEYSANVNFTHRTSGFQNIVDLMLYEEGTCEKESYTFSVEQLAKMFYPIYNFELGGEYIIFVTLDTELVGYAAQPVLASALMVDYKNIAMSANYLSSTSNGAVYEFNLAGYSYYVIGWAMKQEVDMYIGYGVCSSLAEYLALFASDMGGVCGLPGTLVPGPLAGRYNLADLAAQSMANYAPEMSSDTEYYFYIYPVNIESENDLYAAVDKANVFEFGTFTTSGIGTGNEGAISDMTFTSAVILEEANYGWGDFLLQFNADNGDYMVVNAFNIVTDNGAFYEGEWSFSSSNPGFYLGADFSYAVIGGVNYEIFAGNVVIAEVDGKYSFTFTNVNIMLNNEFVPFNASFLGTIEGMILPSEEANILPTVVYTKVENVEGNTWKFSNDAGEYLTIPFNSELVAGKYTASYSGEEFTYDVNNVRMSYNGKETWLASGEVIDVVVNGDIYTISGQLAACDQDNSYSAAPFQFTYEGPLSAGSDEPVVYEGVEITSFEYVARSYDLDDNPETSGGDFVYDITCADGNTFRLGLYWPFADAATGTILNGTYNYCYNALNAMYGGWEGFVIVSETFYHGSKLVVSDDQIALVMPDATYVYNR